MDISDILPPSDALQRGAANVPLDQNGADHAEQIGRMYGAKSTPIRRIISSNRIRALQTAHQISRFTHAPIEVRSGLNPWPLGGLEGQSEAQTKPILDALQTTHPNEIPPGISPFQSEPAESYNTYKSRFLPEFARLMAEHGGSDVRDVLITHGSDLRTLAAWSKAGYPRDFSLDPKTLVNHVSSPGDTYLMTPQGQFSKFPLSSRSNLPPGIYLQRHTETSLNS